MLGSQVRCHFPASSHLVTRQLSSLLAEPETVCPEKGVSASSIICRHFSDFTVYANVRIRRVSGEELTTSLEEEDLILDVRALKRRLNQLYGLPPRFRQRLLLHGTCLEDSATLHPGMELELVMLPFISNPSPDEVQEFTAAAGAGDFAKVHAETETNICTQQIVNRSCSIEGLIF